MTASEKEEIREVFAHLGLSTDYERIRFRYTGQDQSQPHVQTFILMDNTTAQATKPEAQHAELE